MSNRFTRRSVGESGRRCPNKPSLVVVKESPTMSNDPNETNAEVLDAVAFLTASHDDDDPNFRTDVLRKILGDADDDLEIGVKLLGLVSGMTVVARRLLEFSVATHGDKHENSLTDLVADATNTTIIRHMREMTAVAKEFVDYLASETEVSHEAVLARLAEDLNAWPD